MSLKDKKKKKKEVFTNTDFLLKLCHSVSSVLSEATHHDINFSPIVQNISKTCLKPDIGCFVLFDGAFSGLVVINFTAAAAMEVYSNYLLNMGLPKEELATVYTSDEVGNVMGELTKQKITERVYFYIRVCLKYFRINHFINKMKAKWERK